MISHKHKFIFVHIPKCAGSSIKDHFFDNPNLNWQRPNYEFLYGWCPKRKIHLQHATAEQLLETGLISKDVWNSYFKFTFVRNPWDRAYSDYVWMMKDRNLKGSFNDYIHKKGVYKECLSNSEDKAYRGDHLIPQTDFYATEGILSMDFVGKFETLSQDIELLSQKFKISHPFVSHKKRNTDRLQHYSLFYTNSKKRLVEKVYSKDIDQLKYSFEDCRKGLWAVKKLL